MISEWFSKVNVDGGFIDKLTPSQFGKKIAINLEHLMDLKDIDVIICSLDTKKSIYHREMLYQTYHHFDSLDIADLGVFKSDNVEYVLKAIKEIKALDVKIIFLDASLELVQRMIMELSTDSYLNNIIVSESNQLDIVDFPNYDLIGYQKHKCSPASLTYLKSERFNSISLGEYRDDFKQIEPILRDTQFLAFHPNVTQFNKKKSLQIGLNIEESCQIMKYAGLSSNLDILSFVRAEKDVNYAVADMVWYYLEGQNYRLVEQPNDPTGFREYVISSKEQDYDFSFVKSERTGRWWLKTCINDNEEVHYMACSEEEYAEVCKDNVPQRLLKYLAKS